MKGNTDKRVASVTKTSSRKKYIVVISVLTLVGLGIYGIVQLFDYYYNPGGVITLSPGEYQRWLLSDSHALDLQRPRWKGVTDQDTFSVYFGPSFMIDNLISNFTEGLPLYVFSEYLLVEETYYFYNYITIPSDGNWSIIMINPHAYSISVENSLIGLIYPYNIWLIILVVFTVVSAVIGYIRSDTNDLSRTQLGNEPPVIEP